MTKLFLSVNFDDINLAQQIKEELKHHRVEGVIAGDLAEAPPPEVVRSLILASDGLLAIVTSEDDSWIQNEIGIAYAAALPVYALVKEGVQVGGLLPQITTYVKVTDLFWGFDFKKKVAVVASELRRNEGIQAVVDDTEMLVGSSGILQLAIRPRRIPSGEEIITVYVPPEFNVSIIDSRDEVAELVTGIPRRTSTEIPENACTIVTSVAGENDAYPRFLRIGIVLKFPDVQSYLSGGWAEFRLNYRAPATTGRYRLFGTEQVSTAGARPQDASSFDIEPIIVKGEVLAMFLTGIIFTSPHVPLKLPGVVSAIMTMRLDSYTGQPLPDLSRVNAMCYLSTSDEGRYMMTGLAPGIYDVYASAIPFSTSLIKSQLRVWKQPESVDGEVHLTLTTADNAALRLRVEHALKLEQEYRRSQLRRDG